MYYISWPDMHWFTLITVNLLQFIMSDMKGEAIYEDQVRDLFFKYSTSDF